MDSIDPALAATVLAAITAGVCVVDHAGRALSSNAKFIEMLGRVPPEGISLEGLVHELDLPALRRGLHERHDAPGTAFDVRLRRGDAPEMWVSMSTAPLRAPDGGERLVVTCIDVTERKAFERALVDTEDRLTAFLEASSALAWMKSEDGHYVYVNDAFERALGRARAEIVGKTVDDFVSPGVAEVIAEAEARVLATGEVGSGVEDIRSLGTARGSWQTVRFPFWDASGAKYSAGLALDVTAQRRAEDALHQTEEQLRQAQKMEAVGRLAGGLAHDFNNILTVILSCGSLLEADVDPASPTATYVGEITEAAERAALLTRQLLAVSRRQVVQPRVMDVNEMLQTSEKMFRRILGEDVSVVQLLDPALRTIYADPGSLDQVIMNLVVNARDAMPHGGTLRIETANVDLDETHVGAHLRGVAGPHVRVVVADDGVGMDADTRARVFEPFFTTKEVGKGTGLGLSTVFGIVTQASGCVHLTSTEGHGTRFELFFPSVDDAVASTVPRPVLSQPPGRGTILLVEDEEHVRNVTHAMLEKAGYRVLVANGPGEALLVAEKHEGETIDLLLTDVVMPTMSGPALAERLRRACPSMKVLFVSGYPDETVTSYGREARETACLPKPFTPESLTRKIREVLSS